MKKRIIICSVIAFVVLLVAGGVGVGVFGARTVNFENSLTLENKTDGVYVDFSSHPDADGYYIYRSDETEKETITTITKLNKTAFTDKNTESGKVYQYSVQAFNDEGETFETQSLDIMRIETPEILSVKNGVGGIDLSWKKIDGVFRYSHLFRNSFISEALCS